MNNWRLLLLAVVAVLQPIGSFTESNLIDGRQECCDTDSLAQESKLYGNSRKTSYERRLSTRDIREDSQRRHQARNYPTIRFRERLTVERAERKISPDTAIRFGTEATGRFAEDLERRQRSVGDSEFRQDQNRRIRKDNSRDILNRHVRDSLESRRIRTSRDDSRIGRDSRDARTQRGSVDFHQFAANRDTMIVSRERNDVIREVTRRDSRIYTLRAVTRLPLESNRERSSRDQRFRENTDANRRSRSLGSRATSVERENLRTSFISERKRHQNKESRDRSVTSRDSSERIAADRQRETRNAAERVDQSNRNMDYRTNERSYENWQNRDENTLYRERTSERHETRLNVERRQSRKSMVVGDTRSERTVRSNDRTDIRRVATKDMLRTTSDSLNEGRQDSRASRNLGDSRVTRTARSDEIRDGRQQPHTKSLDRVSVRSVSTSDEREVTARSRERNERAALNRREKDVRSVERLDDRREQRYESRMSRDRSIAMLRESRDRRQESRRTMHLSPSRIEVSAHFVRESGIREVRDNIKSVENRHVREARRTHEQTFSRIAHVTERRQDRKLSRRPTITERSNSDEGMSRMREDTDRGRSDVHRQTREENRARTFTQRLAHEGQPMFDSRTTSQNTQTNAQTQRALEDFRDRRREVRQRSENRASRGRLTTSRLSAERIENQQRQATTDLRADAQKEVYRNNRIRMKRFETRRNVEGRSQDRVQRQTRDILAAQSVEQKSRETSRDAEIRSEMFGSRDVRRMNGRNIRSNSQDFRTIESRRESRMMDRQVQPKRHNLAMERMDRITNHASHEVRIETKLSSSNIVLAKEFRSDTRRKDTRFRSTDARARDMDDVDEKFEGQNAMNWQMVFYSLQGAYLCGLLIQMLSEKSTKGKTRNFTWWSSASKELVKVD